MRPRLLLSLAVTALTLLPASAEEDGRTAVGRRLAATVEHLSATLGERSYRDVAKLNRAAGFIERMFRKYGYDVERQAFVYQGNTYYNLIAEARGTDAAKKEILVVGAHYDTAVGTPGADDNASGVAGLLELARLASLRPPERTIRYIAFSLEEPPAFGTEFMGSHVYAKSLRERGAAVHGMVALEMIGYFCDADDCQRYPHFCLGWLYPDRGDYIAFVGSRSSKRFTERAASGFRRASSLSVETLHAPSFVTGVDFSDHRNFQAFGYPAFMVTDTAFYRNGHYHTIDDTPEKLDYERMADIVSGLASVLGSL